MNRAFSIAFLLLAAVTISAQEGLVPLTHRYVNAPAAPAVNVQRARATSLYLPFKEDFYYAGENPYASPDKWTDSSVFISPGMGWAPPSTGVAVFDGLNKYGYPHKPNLPNNNSSGACDTLTSRPINLYTTPSSQTLLPTSNVALSFYYQARGYGEIPESNDSLILDLYQPARNLWVSNVWRKTGPTATDSIFRRAYIPIKDTSYLHDNFRFRFRNSATGSGDFDHWLVDYIYLDQGRDSTTENYDDLAFAFIPGPFLKNYSAMPYRQYNSTEMAQRISVRIRNNTKSSTINMSYDHKVFNQGGVAYSYSGGPDQLTPFAPNGFSKIAAHAKPTLPYVFDPMTETTDYEVKHILYRSGSASITPEFFPNNDSVTQHVLFRNYYAFDDGTPEAGYYVNGTSGRVAGKYMVNVTDTLTGLQIYFDPAGDVNTAKHYSFRIYVWANSGAGPGNVLLKDSTIHPIFLDSVMHPLGQHGAEKLMPQYNLTTPMVLTPGLYYIGVQQQVDKLVIGYDRNYDFHTSLFFNSGGGWAQSQINGSLMMRPVFGVYKPAPTGIATQTMSPAGFRIFPHPVNGDLNISTDRLNNTSCAIYDLTGRMVMESAISSTTFTTSTSHLTAGVYILELRENGSVVQRSKLLVEH